MTSLIDVIFLLLLFFMLSSTFTRFNSVELSPPGSGGGSATRPDIFATVDANGLAINGERIADPEAGKSRIETLLEGGATSALLVPREGATAQSLISALEMMRAGGRLKVVLAR